MKPILVSILFAGIVFKQVLWASVVPVFHTPDEQAHFAQWSYYAETRSGDLSGLNLSREIATVEELLGTKRDGFGNNKFTYHPDHKIAYSDTLEGKEERVIETLSKSLRTEMVGREAAGYPPLYYLLSLPGYYLFYEGSVIDRVFAGRVASLVFSLGLVWAAYKIGGLFANRAWAFCLATLVGFHPMISFVAAGFHPDNLLNLIATGVVYVLLLVIKNGKASVGHGLILALLFLLGGQTKHFMVFLAPIALAVIFWHGVRAKLVAASLAAFFLVAPVVVMTTRLPLPYVPLVTAYPLPFGEYLRFRGGKVLFEIWPWYWGVFKWLGVTLPAVVLKVITRVCVVAGLGILGRMTVMVRRGEFSFLNRAVIFFLVAIFFYLFYLIVWDYQLTQAQGFSQGLQGRYLFAMIVPQMFLLLVGIVSVIPKGWRTLGRLAPYLLSILMITLNGIALYVVGQSYYDLSSGTGFLTQLAQYKPQVVKDIITLLL